MSDATEELESKRQALYEAEAEEQEAASLVVLLSEEIDYLEGVVEAENEEDIFNG